MRNEGARVLRAHARCRSPLFAPPPAPPLHAAATTTTAHGMGACSAGGFSEKEARAEVIATVAQDGMRLRDAPYRHTNDREVVCAAIVSNGSALQFASPTLRCTL